MITPYDPIALWNKAKVFLNRAMDPDGRAFDEQAFWASSALELLAKAALARHSPVLIAEPTEDGRNLLVATGLLTGDARFTSVAAKTIFSRCSRAFRPFNNDMALRIAHARNEYVHGAGIGFLAVPPEQWWSQYWSLATVLIDAQDQDLDALVGSDRIQIVEKYLAMNAHNIEQRVESLLQRARQRLALFQAGQLPAPLDREWRATTTLSAQLSYSTGHTCPACGADGTLEGDDYDDLEYEYDGDEDAYWVTATAKINADHFNCDTCHLVLDGYELLEKADVPTTFETHIEDPEPEQEYGND